MGFRSLMTAVLFLCSVGFVYGNNNVSLYLKAGELESDGKYKEAGEVVAVIAKAEKSAHLYQRAAELFIQAGDGAKAEELLLTAEKQFPDDVYFKFTLGQIYEFTKGNYQEAYKYYAAAANLSNEAQYRVAAARAADNSGNHKEALKIIDSLITENPDSKYFAERGKIYLNIGNRDKAVADFKKAVEIDENMPAMLRLADIYLAENNLEDAKIILEKITSKGGNLIIPELTLGEIYREEKDYDKAIEIYSVAADRLQGKDRAAVLKQLGSIQYEIGDYDNASRSFEWVFELTPEDSASAYFAGYIYEYLGNMEKAKEIYEKALKIHPDYAQLLERMAVIYIQENNPEKALEYAEMIHTVERDVDYYLIVSEVYNMQKNHNKAAIALIAGLEENPTNPDILYSLAMQYEYLKERDKTIDTLKKALSSDPDNPVFQNFLGYVYADMDINLEEAHDLISKALKQDPENAAYIDSMAWVLFKMKDYKKAYEYIEKAFAIMPDDPDISSHLKVIRDKIGE